MANTHETRFLLTAKDRTKAAFGTVRGGMAGLKKSLTGLHTGFLALAGIGGAGLLTKSLIDTNVEFQRIKSSLKTLTGSTKEAAVAFDQIKEFAKTTPFDLQQVTSSFVKLKALGIEPSEKSMRSFGNTASAMGKSLDQMIEAVLDAQTGEMERLKEFGIRAVKVKDEIRLTFQGVDTWMKNTSENITDYLINIGEVNFSGAMQDQMGNMAPAFSNFGAAITELQLAVGEAGFNDAIAGITNELTAMIESMDVDAVERFTKGALGNLAGALQTINDLLDFPENAANTATDFLLSPGQPWYPGAPIQLADSFTQGRATDGVLDRAREAGGGGTFEEWRAGIVAGNREAEKQTGLLERLITVTERSAGAVAQ